jgi:signal transduction histidine kinase
VTITIEAIFFKIRYLLLEWSSQLIFLGLMARLYLTLYGVLFITFGLYVAGLVWIPDVALQGTIQGYYERAMIGVYDLLEDRLATRPQSEWDDVIKELEPDFRQGLGLYELQELSLEKSARQKLKQGALFFTNKEEQAIFYKRVPDSNRYLMIVLGSNAEQQEIESVKGIMRLIEERFLAHDKAEWPEVLAELGQLIKMPLALLPLNDSGLPLKRLDDLKAGRIVVLGLEEQRNTYYKKLADSGLVFRAGPFDIPLILRHFNILLLFLLALVTALAVYLWVRPVWRDLNRFDQGVNRFGAGDLDTRLTVSKRSALKPLAEAFNGMAERMKRLIHSHRELTGAVSHELRTPIARLRFRVDMLEDPQSGDDIKRHISAMRKDILELEELVSESLSYSRLDRERPELMQEPVYLQDWLHALLIETKDDIKGVKAELVSQSCTNQLQVQLDSRLMGRAVKNLLRNGCRHAVSQLSVTGDYENGQAKIVVEDDGSGVPPRERKRIFEPFARLGAARDRESGGVGLGLAIVKQIARWHGGRVWVESTPSGGARFVIAWPTTQF